MNLPASTPEVFDTLDEQFAAFLQRLAGQAGHPSEHLAHAARLVSRATRAGHVCIDLLAPPRLESAAPPATTATAAAVPPFESWRDELMQSPVVGTPGEYKPLILDPHGRLYLQRYWNYETIVTEGIQSRAGTPGERGQEFEVPQLLDRYFGPETTEASGAPNGQRLAVQTALTRRFAVISGGPGTGKTYTIAVLVAALLESAGEPAPRIALAAPTGKAAIRLQEALHAARTQLPCPAQLQDRLPIATSTLHRLLGAITGTTSFRHNATHPLPFDVIIIDEASMVDLALMAKLFTACRPDARLILVGDMDQLASVEAGAVLGDICDGVRNLPSPTSPTSPTTSAPSPSSSTPAAALANCIIQLRKNYRFQDGAGIAALSQALNRGDAEGALALLADDRNEALAFRPLPAADLLAEQLREPVARHFEAILAAPSPGDALRRLGEFRILSALRKGPYGTESINQGIERVLRREGRILSPTPFYPGRPILILKNDYNLRLFNGDVGLALPHPESRELRIWFLDTEGTVRDFAPGRLPEHETVFAMSVHKSQGSEFQNVLMILPDRDSPVLSRELVYTGITRARRRVELWLHEATFRLALARRTERTSGLAARLWLERSLP